MQFNRTAEPPATTSVQGLGLCDALRVELQASQVRFVVDELHALHEPIQEELQRARAAREAVPPAPEGVRSLAVSKADDEISAREYELQVVLMMLHRLCSDDGARPIVFVGPSELVSEIVGAATENAAEALSDLVSIHHGVDPETRERIAAAAEAVSAWVNTFLDCQAVECFSFDPDFSPSRPIR